MAASQLWEPATVAEAGELLGRAAREGLQVAIDREGGDVRLSTAKLARLLEHEAGDLTTTVEAGIRLSELNGALAPHGQLLALDPPGDPTVGAVLAGDLFGPRAYRYGRPRDLVLGVTVVLGDGLVANAGGKVVKNVAGYDLSKLVCGSAGRLGLIVRASFRLHPKPESERTLVVPLAGAKQAQAAARQLLHSQLVPSAADLLWDGGEGRLALLFEGAPLAVASQLTRARELLGGTDAEASEIWDEVAERQARASSRRTGSLGELAATLTALGSGLVRLGALVFAYGDLPPPPADGETAALHERIRAALDPQAVFA